MPEKSGPKANVEIWVLCKRLKAAAQIHLAGVRDGTTLKLHHIIFVATITAIITIIITVPLKGQQTVHTIKITEKEFVFSNVIIWSLEWV